MKSEALMKDIKSTINPVFSLDYMITADEKQDRILLLHIFTSVDRVIRTNNDSTYLYIGDRTKEIIGEDLKN